MGKVRFYKCVKGWARNQVGDIVEDYEFFRYPIEIRQRHFVEHGSEEVVSEVKSVPSPPLKKTSKKSSKTLGEAEG